jgi:hypothetical protein
MKSVPSTKKSYFTYISEDQILHEISIEVQLDLPGNGHAWHIFLHTTVPSGKGVVHPWPNSFVGTKYYKICNNHLYDAVVQAVHNYDFSCNTEFWSFCILKGSWDRSGTVYITPDKRLWYRNMFDKTALKNLTQALSEDEMTYIKQFL